MVTKQHVNTTRNEMPVHVHQNIGSFGNTAEMKRHVNRTFFYPGLSKFRLSCERTLILSESETNNEVLFRGSRS